jgi:myosin heavy subunit
MCINYCNEKLQFHFNEHIFRLEQEMYAAEGVVVPSTDFKDNQPTLDLMEAKGTGIFSMIDEEINVPKGSDQGFLSKVRPPRAKQRQRHADVLQKQLQRPQQRQPHGTLLTSFFVLASRNP